MVTALGYISINMIKKLASTYFSKIVYIDIIFARSGNVKSQYNRAGLREDNEICWKSFND